MSAQPEHVLADARRPSRFRTTREIAIIRQHYGEVGATGCHALLPHLTMAQIYRCAQSLGIRREGYQPFAEYPPSDLIDAQIRKLYNGARQRGDVRALADTLGRPRSWVTSRAIALGLTRARMHPRAWQPGEEASLEQTLEQHPVSVARRLRAAGHTRTATAIVIRRKILGLRRRDDPDLFSARSLAACLGIDAHSVQRWISRGTLPAKRRGTQRTPQQGGDEWVIRRRDVRAFLLGHLDLWDSRRCDQLWLVDILAGGLRGAD